MMWFFAILLVLVMGGIALVAAGRGAPMADAYGDRPDALVPRAGDLAPDDIRRVRFSLAFRGYRMSEVDALLDRLARQLEDHRDRDLQDKTEHGVERNAEQDAEHETGPAPDTRTDLPLHGDERSQ